MEDKKRYTEKDHENYIDPMKTYLPESDPINQTNRSDNEPNMMPYKEQDTGSITKSRPEIDPLDYGLASWTKKTLKRRARPEIPIVSPEKIKSNASVNYNIEPPALDPFPTAPTADRRAHCGRCRYYLPTTGEMGICTDRVYCLNILANDKACIKYLEGK